MITISLCMIVKNEEAVIERCLNSVKDIVDEIVIVDTGSTDNTKDIVKKYTDKLYNFTWIDDFSAARNYSFSKATMDYILWLDADDVILEEDVEKFKKLKGNFDPTVDIVMMNYITNRDAEGNITFSYLRERLSKRSNNYVWSEPVHECLNIYGNIITTDICISHKKEVVASPNRNLVIYEKIIAEGKELSPRGLFYYARELYNNARYDDSITYFNKFLDSEMGWLEDNIRACYDISNCYLLIKDKKNMLKALIRSFQYDTPRSEICCQLGYYYFNENDYNRAIFWYELATKVKRPEGSWGFILNDCSGYLPYIQLCVCYYRIGNLELAIKYNEKAFEMKHDDASVAFNREFFASLNKK